MQAKARMEEIKALLRGEHTSPFGFLGPHAADSSGAPTIVRALLPTAVEVTLEVGESPEDLEGWEMTSVDPNGVFEVELPQLATRTYRFRWRDRNGGEYLQHDPYAFRNLLTEFDFYLLAEGTHYNSYRKLGAHFDQHDGVRGIRFAVWAPNARGVSVIGSFNGWNRVSHPMNVHEGSGIWQLFIPDLQLDILYKYLVRFREGGAEEKIDPYGFRFEVPPRTATVTFGLDGFEWSDSGYLKERDRKMSLDAPISVYEVHLGSWRRSVDKEQRPLSYNELTEQLIPYVKDLGFTHIELMPITEHPYSGSWGYQTTGYFAPTSRFGGPNDFRLFVDSCHREGIGVLLDWVPAHFPRDPHALARFDGSYLYEHADTRKGAHPDWGTLIFNFGRNEVRNFLLSSALFWLDEYHLDGLRVDAVASMLYLDYSRKEGQWVPNMYGGNENLEAIDFIKRFNEIVHHYHAGVLTAAEESTAWPGVSRLTYLGGLGFSLKWNMGWMHDSLTYFTKDPIHRKFHHNLLTFSMIYAFSENFILPLSHDEVVHGKASLLSKMPGDLWQKFANLRSYYGYMWGHPGKKLLFMGGEFGQWNEWNFDSSLDWHLLQWESHRKLQHFVKDLNQLYRSEPALHQLDVDWQGFEWVDFHDADSSIISFIRRSREPDDFLLFVCNFTPVPRDGYRVGVPRPGFYNEVLNSDSEIYGGSNVGNAGGLEAEPVPWNGRSWSVAVTLPPLATIVFKPS